MSLYNSLFTPMLMEETKEVFNDKDYIFEIKFDGTRTLIFVEPSKIKITNKRFNILNDTYPELIKIKSLVKTKCIFDGEIILMFNNKPSFAKLQERSLLRNKTRINFMMQNFPVTFVCFDILYEGKDLTDLPLLKRKRILSKYKDNDVFVKGTYISENGKELFKLIKKNKLEGIIAKKKNSKYYINERTSNWLKIKNWYDDEFFICGYNDEADYVSSLLLAYEDKGVFKYAAKVIIGKKNPDYKIIKKSKIIKTCPIQNYKNDAFTYIKPNLKCTVEYLEKTKNNHLRQPNYKTLKLD